MCLITNETFTCLEKKCQTVFVVKTKLDKWQLSIIHCLVYHQIILFFDPVPCIAQKTLDQIVKNSFALSLLKNQSHGHVLG